jgi:hypothetical protein
MSSSSKRRQTMAKMTRERALQEKRERKQEKKEAKKQLAAEAQNAEAQGSVATDHAPADDVDDVPSNVLADSER